MNYPKYDHYLLFKRVEKNSYNITNHVTKEEWVADAQCVRFVKALDGRTNPYRIDPCLNTHEVDEILNYLNEEGLLEDAKRITGLGLGSVLIPLWYPKIGRIQRIVGAVWNRILLVSWIPLLVIGLKTLLNGTWNYVERDWDIMMGYILGIVFGLLFHELSHAASCIGYGQKCHFFEMGVMLHTFLPGAYVILDYSELKNKYKRVQINAAGIECNLLLCGLFLWALEFEIMSSASLIIAAILNAILAIFNASLLQGLDGMNIFQEAFGCPEDFVNKAKALISNENWKRMLRKRGINGRATIVACYIIVCMQLLLPIILAMNIVSLISLFI